MDCVGADHRAVGDGEGHLVGTRFDVNPIELIVRDVLGAFVMQDQRRIARAAIDRQDPVDLAQVMGGIANVDRVVAGPRIDGQRSRGGLHVNRVVTGPAIEKRAGPGGRVEDREVASLVRAGVDG